jgi:uncharacterized protein (TIGR02453 family)
VVDKEQDKFEGFSPETLEFLRNLKANNNKLWFETHKPEYQEYLLQPLRALVTEMGDFMLMIDPYFEVAPAVNKTISGIHRDTRFSKDKSPYKSTMWITFKRPRKDWQDAPAYFFELSPDSYRYGMGFYSASKDVMDRWRARIDERPAEFLQAISFYSQQQIFVVEGEKYKRVLDQGKPAEIQEWYQRKNLYLVCNRKTDDRLFSRELLDDFMGGFELIAPFYHYLWDLKSDQFP